MTYEELFAAAVDEAHRQGIPVSNATPPANRTGRGADGLRLHYLDWGGYGPPLLTLHGMLTNAHVWDFFSLQLREHFHIHAVDIRGHGDSEWAADGDYRRSCMTADILSLIDDLGLDSLSLVGHSLGGSIGAQVLAEQPGRVSSLVMVDSTLLPTGRTTATRAIMEGPDTFPSLEAFAQHAARINPRRDPSRLAVSLRWNTRQLADGSWTWKWDPALRQRRPPDLERVWAALEAATCPVLFVRAGERSHLSDEAAARLQGLPHVRLVVVPRAAHNVMGDNPVTFNHEVLRFLSSEPG